MTNAESADRPHEIFLSNKCCRICPMPRGMTQGLFLRMPTCSKWWVLPCPVRHSSRPNLDIPSYLDHVCNFLPSFLDFLDHWILKSWTYPNTTADSWPRTERQPFPDPENPDVPILLSNVLAKGEVLEFGMWLGVVCDSWWDSARMDATCPLPMSRKAHGIMANAHPIPHILRASCTAQRQLCNSRERSSKVSQDGTAVGFAGGVPILAIHLAAMQSQQYQTGSQKVGSWITCHCQNSCGPWVFKDRKHGHPLRTLSLEVLPALVYKYMYVCMYVCMYEWMNEWQNECMNVWMYECRNVGM